MISYAESVSVDVRKRRLQKVPQRCRLVPVHPGGREPPVRDLDAEADGIGLAEIYEGLEDACCANVDRSRRNRQRVSQTLAGGGYRGDQQRNEDGQGAARF